MAATFAASNSRQNHKGMGQLKPLSVMGRYLGVNSGALKRYRGEISQQQGKRIEDEPLAESRQLDVVLTKQVAAEPKTGEIGCGRDEKSGHSVCYCS